MSFLPPEFLNSNDQFEKRASRQSSNRFWEPSKQLDEHDSIKMRPCGDYDKGQIICGWQYWTRDMTVKRFALEPKIEEWIGEIGLNYLFTKLSPEAKAQKYEEADALDSKDIKGKLQLLAKPQYFLTFPAFVQGEDQAMLVTFTQVCLYDKLQRDIATHPDYKFNNGVANFRLTITRHRKKSNPAYSMESNLKPPSKAEVAAWKKESPNFYARALFDGGDPFAGKPAEPVEHKGLPISHRDENGADHEILSKDVSDSSIGSSSSWED